MSKIDREEYPAGDRVARIGADLHEADRRARKRRVGVADAVDGIDHAGSSDQRITPPRHRRRPGMCLLPGDRDLVPALALRTRDDTDRLAGGFEDRPLLDMRLEIGCDRLAADRLGTGEPDALEFGAERDAAHIVRPCQTFGEIENAGEYAGADHRRREPRAFFIRPSGDLDRRFGLNAEIVEGAYDLEPRHHAVGAVELAPGRLRIEMAAGHNRRQARVAAGPARKDIADLVDSNGTAGLLTPADEEPARLAVEIACREPAYSALRRRADLRQFHQARPQPLAVDLQVSHPIPSLLHLTRCNVLVIPAKTGIHGSPGSRPSPGRRKIRSDLRFDGGYTFTKGVAKGRSDGEW